MTIALPLLILLALMAAAGATMAPSRTAPWPRTERDEPEDWAIWQYGDELYVVPRLIQPPPLTEPGAEWLLQRPSMVSAVQTALQFKPIVRIWMRQFNQWYLYTLGAGWPPTPSAPLAFLP